MLLYPIKEAARETLVAGIVMPLKASPQAGGTQPDTLDAARAIYPPASTSPFPQANIFLSAAVFDEFTTIDHFTNFVTRSPTTPRMPAAGAALRTWPLTTLAAE